MIHFTPLRKRPALSALMLLILGSGSARLRKCLPIRKEGSHRVA